MVAAPVVENVMAGAETVTAVFAVVGRLIVTAPVSDGRHDAPAALQMVIADTPEIAAVGTSDVIAPELLTIEG